MSDFLIDARFLLRNTTEAFWGAPLIVVDGKDNTFCFGFLRDLLCLRNSLSISAGAVLFGADALLFATEKEIRSAEDMCRELGVGVIHEARTPALATVAAYADRFSNIVTDDRRMLSLCSERRAIYLGKDVRSIQRLTPEDVQRSLGVPVHHVPTYLALTESRKDGRAASSDTQPSVTTREARRLVELYGSLPDIYQHFSTMKSPSLRKKLAVNKRIFDERYRDNSASPFEALPRRPLEWKLVRNKNETLLRERGFYSLIRIMTHAEPPIQPLVTSDRTRSSRTYKGVLTRREFDDMLERVALSKVCAIDTEADDKDPRKATLFGISFAPGRGDAFFVPFCERDMGDLTPDVVRSGLKRIFKERITFVGHNLKYDFMLLHRNDIEAPEVFFDTILAAHECYGDLDSLSLPSLAQRFLGQKINSYKDIVPKGRTFLELPFNEMMDHACVDADVALQLHGFLVRELEERRIDRQFEERTTPLARALLTLEKDGIPVGRDRLERLRCRLANGMLELKRRVSDGIGSEIDLDSREEIAVLVGEKLGLQEVLGRKGLTQSLLEQLASRRPLLCSVVEYKRTRKKLARVESIIRANRQGRVYPLLSQTRMREGRVSSTDPDLFADDGLELRDCIGGASAAWLPDRRRSLDLAQQVSGDPVLKEDRAGPANLNLFLTGQPSLNLVDHDDLLLRVLIGETPHRLSARFLMDRLTVDNIVHILGTRYPDLFRYLAEAKAQGLKRGYVDQGGARRYFDGFGSSSIEKRNAAQVLACRWLLQF
jgi:DNA polymerase I-like protein with 3'-5' exonuclease and polymerase domains